MEDKNDEISQTTEIEADRELASHFNKFQLLEPDDEIDENNSDDQQQNSRSDSDDDPNPSPPIKDPKQNSNSSKLNKNKKRRPRKKQQSGKKFEILSSDTQLSSGDKNSHGLSIDSSENTKKTFELAGLLKLDLRNLNPETELIKMFGKDVLKEEKNREGFAKMRPGPNCQRSRFVPSFNLDVIKHQNEHSPKMVIDEFFNDKESQYRRDPSNASYQANEIYFRYIHDPQYQIVQSEFMAAVNEGASELILQNFNIHPTHVESLVKLSDLMRLAENYKDASQCVERALLILEKGFHPKFNPMSGNCRLTYRRPENRTMYITLFKYITCLNRRGLRRTPLEYSKFLLTLDPVTDPLFAVSFIDYFAIRSEQYDYYIEFVSKWNHSSRLPSFNLSLALAYFLASRNQRLGKDSCGEYLKLADEKLQLALLRFPNFIVHLLDACSAEPEGSLKKCDYFNYTIFGNRYKTVPETVELLIMLYVQRTCFLWKAKHVMSWLEKNVEIMVNKFANMQLIDEQVNIDYWAPFIGPVPRNILRHVILSELNVKLPPSVSSITTLDIDPFPPDSIVSYNLKRSTDRQSNDNSGRSLGIAGLFFRSMMPGFSQDPSQADQLALHEQLAEIQGHIGPGDHSLNEIFNSMLNYMRNREPGTSNEQNGSNDRNNQSPRPDA